MAASKRAYSLIVICAILIFLFPSFSSELELRNAHVEEDKVIRRSLGGAPADGGNMSFVLAADRTRRKDPLDGLNYYTGGWNITSIHYWASTAYSTVPIFLVAAVWFVVFGFILLLACCCFCCCPRRSFSYSPAFYTLSLFLLILATAGVIVGSLMLYDGQQKFNNSMVSTMDYVASQANAAAADLTGLSSSMTAVKSFNISSKGLPSSDQSAIDKVAAEASSAANSLSSRTGQNSKDIQYVIETVRKVLIVTAAVMLLLSLLGLALSLCGLESAVYSLIFVGWLLITATFILSGTFLLLHNVLADTCVAINEWDAHPQEHTALDDILPCVDTAVVNDALNQSKSVTYEILDVVNFVINVSNANLPPTAPRPLYYNQSGPPVPNFCNPFNADLSNRSCVNGEVNFDNGIQRWKSYVCESKLESGYETCITVGRLTPTMYSQMASAVNTSYILYHYGPILANLADCGFVREAFQSVSSNQCAGLGSYSLQVYEGLFLVAVAVTVSLLLWLVHSRERRRRKETNQFIMSGAEHQPVPVQEKYLLSSSPRP